MFMWDRAPIFIFYFLRDRKSGDDQPFVGMSVSLGFRPAVRIRFRNVASDTEELTFPLVNYLIYIGEIDL